MMSQNQAGKFTGELFQKIDEQKPKNSLSTLLGVDAMMANLRAKPKGSFNLQEDFGELSKGSAALIPRKALKKSIDLSLNAVQTLSGQESPMQINDTFLKLQALAQQNYGLESFYQAINKLDLHDKVDFADKMAAINGKSFEGNLRLLTHTRLHGFRLNKLAEIYTRSKSLRIVIKKGPLTPALFDKVYAEYRAKRKDGDLKDYKHYLELVEESAEAEEIIEERKREKLKSAETDMPKAAEKVEKEKPVPSNVLKATRELQSIIPQDEFPISNVEKADDGSVSFSINDLPVAFQPQNKVFTFMQEGFSAHTVPIAEKNFSDAISEYRKSQVNEVLESHDLKVEDSLKDEFMGAILGQEFKDAKFLSSETIKSLETLVNVISLEPNKQGALEVALRKLGVIRKEASSLEFDKKKLVALSEFVKREKLDRYTENNFNKIQAYLSDPANLESV